MDARPNTVTMHIPSPWTSKGIGSAIPASILGTSASYTGIISPTTTVTSVTMTTERNTATGIPLATQTSHGYANVKRIRGIGVVIIWFMVLIVSL